MKIVVAMVMEIVKIVANLDNSITIQVSLIERLVQFHTSMGSELYSLTFIMQVFFLAIR